MKCISATKSIDEAGTLDLVVAESDVLWLIEKSSEVTLLQPTLLRLKAPIHVVGDIHGQYLDLLRIFELGGYVPTTSYLFLGDYVDRGKNSLEVLLLLMSLKIRFPENVFMLRGNHELESVNRVYGFFAECKLRYSVDTWEEFQSFFHLLPLAATINGRIFCIHGGLSPELENIGQIESMKRPLPGNERGMLNDFLWSDPDADILGWAENDRGISWVFGADQVKKFLKANDLDMIVRAHQVVEDGYEFFADRQLVTLFSAPNYCGEFDNAGAILKIDENLRCEFQILTPNLKNLFEYSYVGRPTTPLLD